MKPFATFTVLYRCVPQCRLVRYSKSFHTSLKLIFVPEGRRILAGGESTGNNRNICPGRATDQGQFVALPWLEIDFFTRYRWLRCAAAPVNVQPATGAKILCRDISYPF